jgi:N6-adenosine-specific RNA methylase IME4
MAANRVKRYLQNPFGCIVADPPWPFRDRLPGPGRGAAKHYRVPKGKNKIREIIDLPLLDGLPARDSKTIADDAYLILWRVAAMQREALDVAEGWGFVVKSEIVWRKLTKTGKRHFGMGHHVRAEHEIALICTRGSPKPLNRSTRSVFDAEASRIHSQKPDEFLNLVEATFPGPYLEVYARQRRAGWAQIGDELDSIVRQL